MSAPPPPPPGWTPAPQPSSGGGVGKILLGCGIGCGIFLLLGIAGVVLVAVKVRQVSEEMQARIERMEEAQQRQREARERIEGLEEAHPSRLPEELASTDLSEADVDRWLAFHAALAEPMERQAELAARLEEFQRTFEQFEDREDGREPSWSDVAKFSRAMSGMGDMVDTSFEQEVARSELVVAAATEMERLELGPTELRRLCAAIDWAFLRREGFGRLALTNREANLLEGARSTTELWAEETFEGSEWSEEQRQGLRENIERSRATRERLETKARRAAVLSAATVTTLEGRRAEIESVPDSHARAVLEMLDQLAEDAWWEENEEAIEAGEPLPSDLETFGESDAP